MDSNNMTKSQSEKQILECCIELMHELVDEFKDYLLYLGYDLEKLNEDEELFRYDMSYFHIVQKLFLYHTNHSGGTSTFMKMNELGIGDKYAEKFEIELDDKED